MCWLTMNAPKAKVAKRDIKVFKIVKDDLTSFYKGFRYRMNDTYKLEGKLIVDKLFMNNNYHYGIYEGFHSYSNKLTAHLTSFNGEAKAALVIRIGGYISFVGALEDCGLKIIDCVIPKGSTYYYNPKSGEYVSDSIKIERVSVYYKKIEY